VASINGSLVANEKKIVAFSGNRSAVIGGPNGDYLVVCDRLNSDGTVDVVGRLWGTRTNVYIPAIFRP
jgi:hypothetical protein